ncbi:NAD(P)/FAD-dependent oxidoreductase [Anaerolineales bacterium]
MPSQPKKRVRFPYDVLVIGAGPAGIATAYALEKEGISYQILEASQQVASTWDSLYPSLRLNTSRWFSHLPEKPFPLSFGIFPSAKQYHRYVAEYAQERDYNIRFGVKVVSVKPADPASQAGWLVETDEVIYEVAVVISATGRFGAPIYPAIKGLDRFEGTFIHAHDYHSAKPFQDQRVLIIGNGPSGVDISIDVAQSALRPVLLAIRTGIKLLPRYPLGLPKHIWIMIAERLPFDWGYRLMLKVSNLSYQHQERYGLKLPMQESSSAVPYRGAELLKAVKAGLVFAVDAPIEIYAKSVLLADGATVEVDAMIACTGYQPVCHQYLEIEYACDDQGWPLRDQSIRPNGRQVLGHPGLYLVGVFYKGKGAMYNFNVEAQIAAEQIHAYLKA